MKRTPGFSTTAFGALLASALLAGIALANEATEARSPFELDYRICRKHGWLPVHGKIRAVDLAKKTMMLEGNKHQYVFKLTDETKIWNLGKPGTINQAKIGQDVDAVVKITPEPDQSILAIQISLGKPSEWLPLGIKASTNTWIKSPYAPDQPAFYAKNIAHGTGMKCSYTGKFFIRP